MSLWNKSWFFSSLKEAVVTVIIIAAATGLVTSWAFEVWQKNQPVLVHEGPEEGGRDIWISPGK
mgnify:FL=1